MFAEAEVLTIWLPPIFEQYPRRVHSSLAKQERYRTYAGGLIAATRGGAADVTAVISDFLERYCCPVTSMTEESATTSMALKRSSIVGPQCSA
jgi:hypothetical protein